MMFLTMFVLLLTMVSYFSFSWLQNRFQYFPKVQLNFLVCVLIQNSMWNRCEIWAVVWCKCIQCWGYVGKENRSPATCWSSCLCIWYWDHQASLKKNKTISISQSTSSLLGTLANNYLLIACYKRPEQWVRNCQYKDDNRTKSSYLRTVST